FFVKCYVCFFFQAEDGIRDFHVTGVQTCALPIFVKDFVAALRRGTPAEPVVRRVRLGPRRLRRWFTCPPEKLGENERRFLDMVLEASPSAREAYSLLQEFRRILT